MNRTERAVIVIALMAARVLGATQDRSYGRAVSSQLGIVATSQVQASQAAK